MPLGHGPFNFDGHSCRRVARCQALAQSFHPAKKCQPICGLMIVASILGYQRLSIVCDKNKVLDADVVVSGRIFVGMSTHKFSEVDGNFQELFCHTHHIVRDSGELSYHWRDGCVGPDQL
jgi:hypothetical protein